MISVAVAADEARAAPHAVSSVALIASRNPTCENNLIICVLAKKYILLCDDPCICLSLSPCNSNDDAQLVSSSIGTDAQRVSEYCCAR